jgi:hypothetical protein
MNKKVDLFLISYNRVRQSKTCERSITSLVRPAVILRIGICAMPKILYFHNTEFYFLRNVRHRLHGFVSVIDT